MPDVPVANISKDTNVSVNIDPNSYVSSNVAMTNAGVNLNHQVNKNLSLNAGVSNTTTHAFGYGGSSNNQFNAGFRFGI
jgi:outer membrane autotransporter protein